MYSNSDWGWYIILAPYALSLLVALVLIVRSLKRLIKNYRQPHRYALERLALGSFVAGFLLLINFWLSRSGADEASRDMQAILGAALLCVGVLLSFIAYPPHRRTGAEKAAAKMQRAGWPFWRQHKYTMLLIIIGLLALGLVVQEHIAQVKNQHDFEQARAAIDNIYDNVVRNVGRPDNTEVKNYCSRAHQELTEGDLTCDIDTNFIFSVINNQEANNLIKKIQAQVNNVKYLHRKAPDMSSLKNYSIGDTLYQTASNDYTLGSLDCVINYVYDTPREMDLTIKDPNKRPFEITIGCYGPAKKQYYRLAQ